LSTAYISVGSNLGDRLEYIRQAIRKIKQSKETEICKTSSVYETQPVEYENQPWFLNVILEIKTTLKPLNLLELLLGIENLMGRKRNRGYGHRNIDLDIVLYDDLVLNSDKLTLPHPKMHQRKFVLVPLAEIASEVVHPVFKKRIEELLEELSADYVSGKSELEVKLYAEKIL
jgi:2-amino-4-hydroxy-6-hydroxymethyldihydropteridine diphosphokinase